MGIPRHKLPPAVRELVARDEAADAARRPEGRALDVRLPYPPSVNHYWRHSRGKVYLSAEGREYRQGVADAIGRVRPLVGPVVLRLLVHPPDKRRRDLDNVLKAILDALEHAGAVRDDSQVEMLHVRRKDPRPPRGYVEVWCREMPGEPV